MDDVPGHSVSHKTEIRGDIIQFYNSVYMPRVQQFALRFSNEIDVSQKGYFDRREILIKFL